jgi:hypothetical protein
MPAPTEARSACQSGNPIDQKTASALLNLNTHPAVWKTQH